MHLRCCIEKIFSVVRFCVFLAVIFGLLSAASGDVVAAFHADDCEHHGEQACSNCGDCIHCLPMLYMIIFDISHEQPNNIPMAGALTGLPTGTPLGIPGRIERPPRK